MKIACFSRVTLAHGIHGGMERHLVEVAEGLAQLGHEITVYSTGHPQGVKEEVVNHVQYCYLPTPPAKYRRAWWGESQKIAQQTTADVLWAEGSAGEPVARVSQRPPLVSILQGTYHGEMLTRWRSGKNVRMLLLAGLMWWRKQTWRAHIEKAEHVIAVSQQVAEEAIATTAVSPTRLTIIPNSIDTTVFQPNSAPNEQIRQQYQIPPNAPLFITVCRLEPEKGVHLAIQATAQIPTAHLLVVGKGRALPTLQKLAHERVHFVGFVPHDQLPAYYRSATAFLAPTLRNEGTPVSIIEAMATGLPIIGSDTGGIRAAVTHEQTGLLFPQGNLELFKLALQRFLSDIPLQHRLAEEARQTAVASFSSTTVVKQTEAVFASLL